MSDPHGIAGETWRPIPGYEGKYDVSDLGRVRSCARLVTNGRGTFTWPSRILKPIPQESGYVTVHLCGPDRRSRHRKVHQLVMLAFVGTCPEGMEVCHGDNARANNVLPNLRYDTPANNANDRYGHGTMVLGTKHHRAKMTPEKVREMRRLHAGGRSKLGLARQYGLGYSTVDSIVKRETWRNVI